MNTKEAAQKIARYLESKVGDGGAYKIYHLSAHMCPANRAAVISEMRSRLLQQDEACKIICISTNLIEAGVDISFACVVRSLTGLDSIIQAAGRCNRNGETACGTVYVIYINEEKIGRIAYLRDGQEITREILYQIEKNPNGFPEGAFSKRALDAYYEKLNIKFQGKEMAFPLKDDLERTIIDLLTTNPRGKDRCKAAEQVQLKQAFKAAGDAFAVIEEMGKKDVIVEYNQDACEHLEALLNARLISQQKKELRYLQQYTVQLSPYTIEKIGAGIRTVEELGIMILSKDWYDKQYGVDDAPRTLIL